MQRLFLGLVGFLGFTPGLFAQREVVPPLVGRPDHFSGVVGLYRISATAQPTKVRVEEPITLEVRIAGSGPEAHRPRLDQLRLFPEDIEHDFFIEPIPEKNQAWPEKEIWQFTYRLRPKQVAVNLIPGLKLIYYHPGRRKFQSAYADGIPITVEPAAQAAPTIEAPKILKHPDRIYRLRSGPHVFRGDLFSTLYWPIVIAGYSLPPLLFWWRVRRWRQSHLGARDLARRRRTRAGQIALGQLHGPVGQDGAMVAGVMAAYLRERFDFPALEPTLPEVDRLLIRLGADKDLRRKCAEFLADCDAQRFDPHGESVPLNGRGLELIEKLEALSSLSQTDPGAEALMRVSAVSGRERRGHPRRMGVAGWLLIFLAVAAASGMGWWQKLTDRHQPLHDQLATAHRWFQHDQDHPEIGMRFTIYNFQMIARTCSHADVWHDLGNAYLLVGDVPAAIYAYRQGLLLAPGDAGLTANLEYARARVIYPQNGRSRPEGDPWPHWLPRFSLKTWVLGGLICYLLAWAALTRWWTTGQSAWLRGAALGFFCSAAGMLGWWWTEDQRRFEHEQPLVVVVQNQTGSTPFLRGNGPSYPPVPEIPQLQPGTEARRLGQRGGWLLIRLGSGEIGWVPQDAVLMKIDAGQP